MACQIRHTHFCMTSFWRKVQHGRKVFIIRQLFSHIILNIVWRKVYFKSYMLSYQFVPVIAFLGHRYLFPFDFLKCYICCEKHTRTINANRNFINSLSNEPDISLSIQHLSDPMLANFVYCWIVKQPQHFARHLYRMRSGKKKFGF